MGVHPRLVDRIRETPHASIQLLSPALMADVGLVTDGDAVRLLTELLGPGGDAMVLNRILPTRRELYEVALAIDPKAGPDGHAVRGLVLGPAWTLARSAAVSVALRAQGFFTELKADGSLAAISKAQLCRAIGWLGQATIEVRIAQANGGPTPVATGSLKHHHVTGAERLEPACDGP